MVCNGCTDGDRRCGPHRGAVGPGPGSAEAVEGRGRPGGRRRRREPSSRRVRLDADVAILGTDVLNLVRALRGARGPGRSATEGPAAGQVQPPGSLVLRRLGAAAPGAQRPVRARRGRRCPRRDSAGWRPLPQLMSDDLAMPEAFAPGERRVVWTAFAEVRAPGTIGDLIRRRVRVATGNSQSQVGVRRPELPTARGTLLACPYGIQHSRLGCRCFSSSVPSRVAVAARRPRRLHHLGSGTRVPVPDR